MKDWSRRNMLRATAGVAIAVPMAALSAVPANAAAATSDSTSGADGQPTGALSGGPVMFCIHDARSGQVSILHGSSEVVVTDRQLVARILSAAAATA